MSRQVIHTEHAPAAIGTYSQAILVENTLYLSGQIGLDPYSMELVEGIEAQIRRVFDNLKAVCVAADASLEDITKLNIYLTDLSHFQLVNQIMGEYFAQPYPARAALGVASLPKGALVEMDGIVFVKK
ncbi:RidA family protein [Acinetobacter qingfengensis]|uniref:Reactive intermediate/imine deaminase n=1 Tax=Acinetobacter qingfengensis TaxID=1262585 RepID=A0A1E7QXI8_9GAMM|nr:RidA family protein [Acinetobacter qingfengensis]KAA8731699.1 RidA family protein [Acinetobacter qingfengensis]OEY91798.1 reactive intermediate/imine deaminase [Acinetobacter qingfengensis]